MCWWWVAAVVAVVLLVVAVLREVVVVVVVGKLFPIRVLVSMVRSVLSSALAVLRVQMWEVVPASAQSLLAAVVAEKVDFRMAQ